MSWTGVPADPYLYVTEVYNTSQQRITKYDKDLAPVASVNPADYIADSAQICSDGTYIYVSDRDAGSRRLCQYNCSDLDGVATAIVESPGCPYGICTDGTWIWIAVQSADDAHLEKRPCADLGTITATYGTKGSGDTQFNVPKAIATDGVYLYVCDTGNNRIKKHLCSDMSYVGQVGSVGTGDGQFDAPEGVCYAEGFIYVGDTGNDRIQKFNAVTLAFVSKIGTTGTGNDNFDHPTGLCADATNLFVADRGNGRIVKRLCSDLSYVSEQDESTGGGSLNLPDYVDSSRENSYYYATLAAEPTTVVERLVSTGVETSYTERASLALLQANAGSWYYDSGATRLYIHPTAGTGPDALDTGGNVIIQIWAWDTASVKFTLGLDDSDEDKFKFSLGSALGTNDRFIMDQAGNLWLAGTVTGTQLISTVATGTPGIALASTTEIPNLNANYLQGNLASAFAPVGAKYIVQQADATLTAEQALGALATGILKSTTTTGVLSIAEAGTDYEAALGNPGTTGWVLSSTDAGVRSWIAPGGGAAAFTDLTDVPAVYTGDGGKVVKVKADETGLEFVAGGAGVASFNDLDDVPASYVDQAGLFVRVKATEDGLEYAAGGAGAPTAAKYIVQEAHADLSAEQSLGALTTGLLKNTVAASVGVLSTADAYDYSRHCHVYEAFDGLATGDINGLGSYFQCGAWVNNNAATCTTTVAVKSGADKMLRCFAPAGAGNARTELTLSSTIGLAMGGRVRYKMRIDQDGATYSGGIVLANAAGTTRLSVRFLYSSGLKIAFSDGSAQTNIQAASKNTWYQIDLVWVVTSATTGIAKIFIDGAYATTIATGTLAADIDGVDAYATPGAADVNCDIDDLYVYSLMPLMTE